MRVAITPGGKFTLQFSRFEGALCTMRVWKTGGSKSAGIVDLCLNLNDGEIRNLIRWRPKFGGYEVLEIHGGYKCVSAPVQLHRSVAQERFLLPAVAELQQLCWLSLGFVSSSNSSPCSLGGGLAYRLRATCAGDCQHIPRFHPHLVFWILELISSPLFSKGPD